MLDTGWSEVQLVRLDDIYPGWGGLDAGSAHIRDHVLVPLAACDGSARPRWRRWDWLSQGPAEWHDLDPARPVVIEGCGALSRSNRVLAEVGVWVEMDEPTRKLRALARDGETYGPHWDRWAAQEDAFIAREQPTGIADHVVHGDFESLGRLAGSLIERYARAARPD